MSADIGPIAQHGINNLVGGWGCRGLPNNDRLKRSAVTLHCLELRLVDTLVIGLGGTTSDAPACFSFQQILFGAAISTSPNLGGLLPILGCPLGAMP